MKIRITLPVLVILLGICGSLRAQEEDDTRAFQLTASEKRSAIERAETEITQRNLRTGGPLYLVRTRLVRDKRPGGSTDAEVRRLAQVTHYRYDGDLAILTLIDLEQQQVLEVREVPHLTVPLAEEELDGAQDLALADPRVRKELGSSVDSVLIEALVLRTPDEKDQFFGHRVVRLLFLRGGSYLDRPVVLVDLTARKVVIVPVPDEPHPH
jgi:hypothetical protein